MSSSVSPRRANTSATPSSALRELHARRPPAAATRAAETKHAAHSRPPRASSGPAFLRALAEVRGEGRWERGALGPACAHCPPAAAPQVLPLLRAMGATGLLLEYEDAFPYAAPLEALRAPHAYR